MATFNLNGYNSYSGCDIVVTARLNTISNGSSVKEKVYTLGSLQTLSVSTHQDKKAVRVIGSVNALDYTMGPRTIAGSLVFAVFDQHFATEMFNDLEELTGKTFFLPDELPAIDLTITFANEYGRTSRMAIYGVRIINEGQVMSVNDLYTENTYQFVANAMEPLKRGTGGGLNSNKTNEAQVVSAFNFDSSSPILLGEDIYTYSLNSNSDDLKRVLINVSVEQPTYETQEGIAKTTLSPMQNTGVIMIYNQLQDKIEKEVYISDSNTSLYDVLLEQGLYSAWYEDNGKILSNTVVFSIDIIGNYNGNYDDSPIIENVTNNSIEILSNNPSHTIGVCVDKNTSISIEEELSSKKCTFNNLNPNNTYVLYTKQNNSYSKSVQCKTLSDDEDFINSFKEYVEYNSSLLSADISEYQSSLSKLSDKEDITYTLSKENTDKSNELMYMAIKYKNEFNRIINEDKIDFIPSKNLENIFGNTITFDSQTSKCNIFYVKNKREYFVDSEQYPTEITYSNGKSNTIYNVMAISDSNIKSPKYTFYNYSENNKANIEKLFGKSNQLAQIDLTDYAARNPKKTENELKCLAVLDNKNIDLKLLKCPSAEIDENNNIVFDVNYIDSIGEYDNEYYICISNIDECLDDTSFRKIKIHDKDKVILANKYNTAINNNNIFTIWIEDENFNVISDIGFVSALEEIQDFNYSLVEEKMTNILSKINSFTQKNSISDVIYYVNNASMKNIYYEIANAFINLNINNLYESLFELFKLKFNDFYINQEKFKKAYYDNSIKKITFDMDNNFSQLVNIRFKQNQPYEIEIKNGSSFTINNDYDYNLFYAISNNSSIKSGFVLIDNKNNVMSHSIMVEEVK